VHAKIEARLKELDITLPLAAKPAASYVPYVQQGDLVIVSGQLPFEEGQLAYTGQADHCSIKDAQAAARLCAVQILSQLHAAIHGDWARLTQVVRLGIFVNASHAFTDAHLVANGASDLMLELFGQATGQHARAAVCTSSLPMGAMVEVEATFAVKR
jgi:enamine deaminase RidA (YjgF/YER057c/UK114 family)